MSFFFKDRLSIGITGSSHGEVVGVMIDGLPAGVKVDHDEISLWMARRAPGTSKFVTQRKEKDEVRIKSGVLNGRTDGGSIYMEISNGDTIQSHYDEIKKHPRPGHGDLSLYIKYGEFRNYSGGGFLSGRMTAPLVAAGSLLFQFLRQNGIEIMSYIKEMGGVKSKRIPEDENIIYEREARMGDEESETMAESLLLECIKNGDTVGAIIETIVKNPVPGIGEPFFDSIESVLSHLLFSVPGLKGIEFGNGFNLGRSRGKDIFDPFIFKDGGFRTEKNVNGGILGGIAYGDDIVFRVAMKPTSSIRDKMRTIDVETGEPYDLTVKGRHDPCIAIRAVPVIKSVTAIAIADLMLAGNLSK
ncbi:chorismate synthase [Caldiplasma sukawensis]